MTQMSLRAYGRHRGVSLRAVQKAIEAGRIKRNENGKIDAELADASWQRNTDPARQRKAEPPPAPEPPLPPLLGGELRTAPRELANHPDWSDLKFQIIQSAPILRDLPAQADRGTNGTAASYAESRAVREYWEAVSAQAKGLQQLGRLEDVAEIQRHQLARAAAERDALLAWPSRIAAVLAAELGIEERHLNAALDREIRIFLTERSRIGRDADKPAGDGNGNGHASR